MMKNTQISRCTLRLLAIASQATYKILVNTSIRPGCYQEEGDAQTLNQIAAHGYAITETLLLPNTKHQHKTRINALCLSPQDNKNPIIISFRGTKSYTDFYSNLVLSIFGVVEKKRRDAAYIFYQNVRKNNPDREIVLTGHSLGGHIAQYVASKAYSEAPLHDLPLLSNPVIQVRTFNTAPIKTNHQSIFNKHHRIYSQIINYRLSSDFISNVPLQPYHGNTFVFPCNVQGMISHSIKGILEYLPKEILDQFVSISAASKNNHLLIEYINGIQKSYECRVNGQFFSRCRAGVKNLAKMEESFLLVREHIRFKKHAEALTELKRLKDSFQGKVSKKLVHSLILIMERSIEAEPIALEEPLIHNLAPSVFHG